MFGLRSSAASARTTKHRFRPSRLLLRGEAGFTLIEVVIAGIMLAILSVPIAGMLSTTATMSRLDRERTGADQLAQAQIEQLRTLPYTQVGITGANPPGVLSASTTSSLPSGEAVTIATQVNWVADPIPTAYVTNADYKKVVLTVTRNSDGAQLAQKTTYIASASAPPFAGSTWDQIKRQVIDAVTNLPLPGASVNLTGGPGAENRTATTDGSGTVLFPALTSSAGGTPVFTLATTLSGYNVFPDDISPGAASSVSSTAGVNSIGTVRMYKATSLTVNLKANGGAAYTSGATISVDSSRCGQTTVSIPSGSSSTTITTCNYATGKSVPLPPNVSGQTPADADYFVTAWSNSGGFWVATPSTGVLVPSAYPTTLTQSVTLTFPVTTYTTTKVITVTVKKSGANDTNARVELTAGPAAVYLYATTNASGQASFTVPVTTTGFAFTGTANDMGAAWGTANTANITTSTTSPIALTVNIA
jgi:Tfp pilus assembly protein PilE